MDYRKYGLMAVCALLLASCGKGAPSTGLAECTVGKAFAQHDLIGNAGCLIKIDGKAVLANEGWSISPPGGGIRKFKDQTEAAWQTACRETQEEVWIAPIKVEKLLHSFGKYHLFHCTYDAETTKSLELVKSIVKKDADPANLNGIRITLKDPEDVPEGKWRFPEHRTVVMDLFDKLP